MAELPPSSAVRLAARAYRAIEHHGEITSFEDGTPEAEDAALHYGPCRRQTLEAADWRFASVVFVSGARSDAPEIDGLIPYAIDPSVLRVREVTGRGVRWRVEGRLLYTDAAAPVTYRGTIDAQEPSEFTPKFEGGLVYLMAHHLAPRWSTSQNRAVTMLDLFRETIEAANPDEAREASAETWTDSDTAQSWGDVMGCGYGGAPYGLGQ